MEHAWTSLELTFLPLQIGLDKFEHSFGNNLYCVLIVDCLVSIKVTSVSNLQSAGQTQARESTMTF